MEEPHHQIPSLAVYLVEVSIQIAVGAVAMIPPASFVEGCAIPCDSSIVIGIVRCELLVVVISETTACITGISGYPQCVVVGTGSDLEIADK